MHHLFPHADAACRNVGDNERLASGVVGAAMVAAGLASGRKRGWLLALLGGGLIYRGLSGNCKAYEAMGITTADAPLPHGERVSVPGNHGIKVEKTIFIRRPPADLFQTWRNFENLPHFMSHIESVRVLDGRLSHWIA